MCMKKFNQTYKQFLLLENISDYTIWGTWVDSDWKVIYAHVQSPYFVRRKGSNTRNVMFREKQKEEKNSKCWTNNSLKDFSSLSYPFFIFHSYISVISNFD